MKKEKRRAASATAAETASKPANSNMGPDESRAAGVVNNSNGLNRTKKGDEGLQHMHSQLDCGYKVCIDLSYCDGHSLPARNSIYKQVICSYIAGIYIVETYLCVVIQVSLSYAALKRSLAPVALHLVSLDANTRCGLVPQGTMAF